MKQEEVKKRQEIKVQKANAGDRSHLSLSLCKSFFNATVSFILQLQCILQILLLWSDYTRISNNIIWYRETVIYYG
jgi:hypothetical protein